MLLKAFLFAIATVSVMSGSAFADPGSQSGSFKCAKVENFIITAPTKVHLQCNTAWPDTTVVAGSFELWRFPDNWQADPTQGPQQYVSGPISRATPNIYLELNLAQPIEADKKYILLLRTASSPAVIDMYVEFSTEAKGVIAPSGASAELGRVFVVTSSTSTPAVVTVSPADPANRKRHNVTPSIAFASAPRLSLTEIRDGATISHKLEDDNPINLADQTNFEVAGTANVEMAGGKKLRQSRAVVGVAPKSGQSPLTSVLQTPVKVGEPIDLQPVPVGKDDANTYFQLSHFAGVGTKPAYAINIKEKTFLFFDRDLYAGDFLIQPDILVDIATNSLARKTDDTIKIGFTATKTFLRTGDEGYKKLFQGIKLAPGVTYETNRGFHKNNLLFTFDSNPLLKDFYQSREVRRYKAAAEEGKNSVTEIPEGHYKWGGGLEFFIGLEAGGALSSQTFQNKKKTTSLTVPQYSIFRFRPKVHAFVEYDRFSLDWSGTLRGLLTPEYAGEELADGTIRLRRITNWQAYSELTGAFLVDRSRHIALTITYKRGAQPPNYPHVQTVSTGFTLKY